MEASFELGRAHATLLFEAAPKVAVLPAPASRGFAGW